MEECRVLPMLCRECGSDRLRPSRPQGLLESTVRRVTGTRYHECSVCGTRTRFKRKDRDATDTGVDVFFWVAVALLGVGFVALLRWVG
jgi:phage/plasmid primase-like uncharacterized protein